MNMIKDVRTFMRACGQTVNQNSTRQTALYTGLQCEELAEKLEAIVGAEHASVTMLKEMSKSFKSGSLDDALANTDRVKLFDADVDLIWVAVGATLSMGADTDRGWSILTDNNMSKVDPVTGHVLKDQNGKVQKPPGYRPPDFRGVV